VPDRAGTDGLEPLGVAGEATHLTMVEAGRKHGSTAKAPTSVALFDQGLTQVVEASRSFSAPAARPVAHQTLLEVSQDDRLPLAAADRA
jgi:hypothetical protein